MTLLPLDADQLLTTTRAVRKRLDFSRPVDDDVIRACVATAMQAPSGSNNMTMQFIVIRDAEKRAAIGEIYRQCYAMYKGMDGIYARTIAKEGEAAQAQQARVADSADYLGEHMGEAPVLVIACNAGVRTDRIPAGAPSILANVLPAMWSFMLAARARGLGTAWTTVHLFMEHQVADLLGLPFDTVEQVCLSPLAYTLGTEFKAAGRPEPDSIIHWDQW